MNSTTLRFTSFPRTIPPPPFVADVMKVFAKHEASIATENLLDALNSSAVLAQLQPDLTDLGFLIEKGNKRVDQIVRPVFFGENGKPTLKYCVDAYHEEWRCGLEVEASRGWLSNAVFRDIMLPLITVGVDHLIVAVVNRYVYRVKGKQRTSPDYRFTTELANALYAQTKVQIPHGLTVIGY